jgi:subtilisin family serine protease
MKNLVAVGWLLLALGAFWPALAAPDKIDPWVIEQTANGAAAHVLIVLADQADLSGAHALPTKPAKGRYVYQTLWDKAQATQGPLLRWLAANRLEYRAYYIVNAVSVIARWEHITTLAARPDVARIAGNPPLRTLLPQPLPFITEPRQVMGMEPNIAYIHADDVWALGYTGQGIVMGGQDTGYDWDHPALKPHYRGWDGTAAQHDYNWHDSIHTIGSICGADASEPCDDYGHGTHTMGTALGGDGGANQIGVAPGAQWIGCRNMNHGVGSPQTYLECFEFFLAPYPIGGTPAQGRPELAPDVTINSWTCPITEGCGNVNILQDAIAAQQAAGIMTIASAGNSGPACSTIAEPPAIYAQAFTVGALQTGTDGIASFSSRWPVTVDGSQRRKPDLTAPGTTIRSSVPGGGYSSSYSGTSMAGPHVAGAVALLWSAYPALKNQITATAQILLDSAVPISSTACASSAWPNNTFGYGRLDALAALNLSCRPLSGVSITAPVRSAIYITTPVTLQVEFTPTQATRPFSYMLNYSGPLSTTRNPLTYTLHFTAPGAVSIQLAAWNCAMTRPLTASLTVPVRALPVRHLIYLPLVLAAEGENRQR